MTERQALMESLGEGNFDLLSPKLRTLIYKAMREFASHNIPNQFTREVAEIITFFNEIVGTRYRQSKTNQKPIRARLRGGLTVDEAKGIIILKLVKWKHDPHMSQYLRISTLFRETNCEEYRNELIKIKTDPKLLSVFKSEARKHGLTYQETIGDNTQAAFHNRGGY